MLARLSLLLLSALLLMSAIRAGSVATAAQALPCASACAAAATTAQSMPSPLAADADADAAEELLVAPRSVPRAMAAAAHPLPAESAPHCRSYRRPALRPPVSDA
jgi:hypothetical protein